MAHAGTAHKYAEKLIAFEHAGAHSRKENGAVGTLLWIGGLGDGLLTVQYPSVIAARLNPDWALAEVLLSASYQGWGTSSLHQDANELAQCVTYFQKLRPHGRIVLMGHSTGCQDIMEYLVGRDASSRPPIHGAILQGSVSDREAWTFLLSSDAERASCAATLAIATDMLATKQPDELVPRVNNIVAAELGAPMTAYRTHSLLARGGDDDYFSTDLEDAELERSFGRVPKTVPVMFLLGSEDPFVHGSTDKAALLGRWAGFVKRGGGTVDEVHGGVVEGGHHNLDGDPHEVVEDLVGRVVGFVEGLGSAKV